MCVPFLRHDDNDDDRQQSIKSSSVLCLCWIGGVVDDDSIRQRHSDICALVKHGKSMPSLRMTGFPSCSSPSGTRRAITSDSSRSRTACRRPRRHRTTTKTCYLCWPSSASLLLLSRPISEKIYYADERNMRAFFLPKNSNRSSPLRRENTSVQPDWRVVKGWGLFFNLIII